MKVYDVSETASLGRREPTLSRVTLGRLKLRETKALPKCLSVLGVVADPNTEGNFTVRATGGERQGHEPRGEKCEGSGPGRPRLKFHSTFLNSRNLPNDLTLAKKDSG